MLPYLFSNSTTADADQVNANFADLSASGLVQFFAGLTPPSGWLLLNGYTIGDATSGASARANADTLALFTQIWSTFANTECPIYNSAGTPTTRGASAILDYGAHKRLALPNALGKTLMMYDASQTEFNTMGKTGGEKAHALTTAELASHYHSVDPPSTASGGITANHTHAGQSNLYYRIKSGLDGSWAYAISTTSNQTGTVSSDHAHWTDIAAFNSGSAGSGTAHNTLSPYLVLQAIIKI